MAGITLGIRRPDIRSYFENQAEDLVEIVKLGIFAVRCSPCTACSRTGGRRSRSS